MISAPKWLLRLEGLVVLVAAVVVYHVTGGSWWEFALLFLVPDVFMTGYFFGNKAGAGVYNTGHTYAAPFLLWVAASLMHLHSLFFIPVIWVAHIGFDRLLGYG